MRGRQIQSPEIFIPSRKKSPLIGTSKQDEMEIDSKQEETKGHLEKSAQIRQLNSFNDSQSPIAPPITVGLRIDMLLNTSDVNAESSTLVWSQDEVKAVSNGNNFPKEDGRFHKKGIVLFFGIEM